MMLKAANKEFGAPLTLDSPELGIVPERMGAVTQALDVKFGQAAAHDMV